MCNQSHYFSICSNSSELNSFILLFFFCTLLLKLIFIYLTSHIRSYSFHRTPNSLWERFFGFLTSLIILLIIFFLWLLLCHKGSPISACVTFHFINNLHVLYWVEKYKSRYCLFLCFKSECTVVNFPQEFFKKFFLHGTIWDRARNS